MIAVRVHRTFSLETNLVFTVVARPAVGSCRVFDRCGDHAELVHLAASRQAAELLLTSSGMISPPNRQMELRRMEDALRQTRHQLAMIERQIIARMTALIPRLVQRRSGYRRGKPRESKVFLARYRSNLAAITAERQPEIDALSRKLARQEAAIAALRVYAPLPCGADRAELKVGGIDRRS